MKNGIRMKIDEADRLFSLFIRHRDKWQCIRCLSQFKPGTSGLTNSHFFGRGMKSVRYDEENCDALCWPGCHLYWQNGDREAYREFKIKQLGQERFDKLVIRANLPQRIDKTLIVLYYKTKLKEMGV